MLYVSINRMIGTALAHALLAACQSVGTQAEFVSLVGLNREESWPPECINSPLRDNRDLCHNQKWLGLKRSTRAPRGRLAIVRNQSRENCQQQRQIQKRKTGRRNGSQRGN